MKLYLAQFVADLKRMAPSLAVVSSRDGAPRIRLLLSFYFFRDEDMAELLTACQGAGAPVDVFADSGAYSALTCGTTVDEDEYIRWVERWASHFTVAAGPDVIGDPVATRDATLRMRERVTSIPVLPTFHVGEDWRYLDFWAERTDYLALGGMVPFVRRPKLLTRWCAEAFRRIPPTTRVHGFGLTTMSMLQRFPWYSADSSTWANALRFASLRLFDEQRGRIAIVEMADRLSILRSRKLLEFYGLRATQTRNTGFDRLQMLLVCINSWQRAERWLDARRTA